MHVSIRRDFVTFPVYINEPSSNDIHTNLTSVEIIIDVQ